jgi:hypothetical protein
MLLSLAVQFLENCIRSITWAVANDDPISLS